MSFYVVRSHSHTDQQLLWKVMTRPLSSRQIAENEIPFFESVEKNYTNRFFVVEVQDD